MEIKIFGLTLSLKGLPALAPVTSRGLWWPIIKESFTGAWQRNEILSVDDVVTNPIVWACATLIASDISKLWLKLVERDPDEGIWTETTNPAYSPVLRKPNHYSTRIKFYEYWILCKLLRGNTYVLKERDSRNVVVGLYILEPTAVQVLIAPDGSVFYQISQDALSGLTEPVTVPAREIIHDVMVPLYHPLVGVSPIYACGMAALQGLKIQAQSSKLFANGSQPGGILTAPGIISNETADRLRAHWEANYGGAQNVGKVAVLGDGLKYEPMTMTAVDAQLIDQLRWTDERICACFHVPLWKVSAGPMPAYGNVQAANIEYYSQALQALIENLEELLDEGLATGINLGVEFDLDALLRMDTATQMDIAVKAVGGAVYAPNEARQIFDLPAVTGGDTPYLQQQNFSLDALNRRDEANPAPSSTTPATTTTPTPSTSDATATDTPDQTAQKVFDVGRFNIALQKDLKALAA